MTAGFRRSRFAATGGYKAGPNAYGGGDKKVGLGTNGIGKRGTNERFLMTNAYATPLQRRMVFCGINMLGGIGVGRSQFASGLSAAKPDGLKKCSTYVFEMKH